MSLLCKLTTAKGSVKRALFWRNRQMKIVSLSDFSIVLYHIYSLLKFPDIGKLNTCMPFYDNFSHEKFPNIPVSLVSEMHSYNARSASKIFPQHYWMDVSFGIISRNLTETNHLKK